ncbi:MAG: RNA-protein complex protein Nop10 [Candidatus Marsarchaeota archaeon]|nr:RNA-protein complex protein Nop10 [Candidatus Marsarchaeota archaeon]
MRGLMRKCARCGVYTMKDRCPVCRRPVVNAHPPKFSPDDRYIEYRRPEAYQPMRGAVQEKTGETN